MAVGFSKDGAVEEMILASLENAIDFARSNLYNGESLQYCRVCDEEIPERRRVALKGVQTCINCQEKLDKKYTDGLNRRASKDALLR